MNILAFKLFTLQCRCNCICYGIFGLFYFVHYPHMSTSPPIPVIQVNHVSHNVQPGGEAQNATETAPTAESAAENPQLDMSALSSQFAKFATESATEDKSDADFTKCLADTMKHLSENNTQLQVFCFLLYYTFFVS